MSLPGHGHAHMRTVAFLSPPYWEMATGVLMPLARELFVRFWQILPGFGLVVPPPKPRAPEAPREIASLNPSIS